MITKPNSGFLKKVDTRELKENKNTSYKFIHHSSFPPLYSISFGSVTTLEKENLEDNNSDIEKKGLQNFTQRSNFQNLPTNRKWNVLINAVITVKNLRKFKTQVLSIENFDSVFDPLKKEKKLTERSQKIINKDSEKDPQMDYIMDQIQLFQLIEFGYDKHEDKIKELIKKHNFVNDINYEKRTPLYEACLNGYPTIAKILIDNGADPLKLSCENESVLDVAVRMNYVKLTKFLLDYYTKWPSHYIYKAKSLTSNSEIKRFILRYEKKYNRIGCCMFGS